MGKPPVTNPVVYLHSSEEMHEVDDHSVHLLLGASIYLGPKAPWSEYRKIYKRVYCQEGTRVLRDDGLMIVLQTDAYQGGGYIPRLYYLLDLLFKYGWTLIDRKIWVRQKASLFQVSFSDVMLLVPPGGSMTRMKMNQDPKDPKKMRKEWIQTVWHFPPSGESDNAYPAEMCGLIVRNLTKPGDLIVDPFAGSAKLGGVAYSYGRRYAGYEIDEEAIPTIRKNGCDVNWDGKILPRKKSGLLL